MNRIETQNRELGLPDPWLRILEWQLSRDDIKYVLSRRLMHAKYIFFLLNRKVFSEKLSEVSFFLVQIYPVSRQIP